eukprot:4684573-Karenia_brevis.AAC.1
MADWFARKGAARNTPPADVVNRLSSAKRLAKCVQQMMVDIVLARLAYFPLSETEVDEVDLVSSDDEDELDGTE